MYGSIVYLPRFDKEIILHIKTKHLGLFTHTHTTAWFGQPGYHPATGTPGCKSLEEHYCENSGGDNKNVMFTTNRICNGACTAYIAGVFVFVFLFRLFNVCVCVMNVALKLYTVNAESLRVGRSYLLIFAFQRGLSLHLLLTPGEKLHHPSFIITLETVGTPGEQLFPRTKIA